MQFLSFNKCIMEMQNVNDGGKLGEGYTGTLYYLCHFL